MTNKELQQLLSCFPSECIVKVACDGVARDFKDAASLKRDILIVLAEEKIIL